MDTLMELGALTDEQRRLVRENIGLVGVHLRRHVRGRPIPTRDREWADLFQEGCLGLIRAARTFDPQRGIPFAAWALLRIRTAVREGILGGFATIRHPKNRRKRDRPKARRSPHAPDCVALGFEPAAGDRHHPANACGEHETIGQRLRDKLDAALVRASQYTPARGRSRPDREALVQRMIEERLSVPDEAHRTPLRELARQTNSAYARVAQCEQRLLEVMRRAIASDPQTAALLREARRGERGLDTPIDAELELRLVAPEIVNAAAS